MDFKFYVTSASTDYLREGKDISERYFFIEMRIYPAAMQFTAKLVIGGGHCRGAFPRFPRKYHRLINRNTMYAGLWMHFVRRRVGRRARGRFSEILG